MSIFAVVLVCLATLSPHDCNRATAVSVTPVPDPAPSFALCDLAGQSYAAEAELVHEGQYLKVTCTWGRGAPTA
jgi:hypothetical protein